MNKKNYVKNNACYQFDYIMKVIDINARDIFLDEKKKNLCHFIQNFYGFNTIAYQIQ